VSEKRSVIHKALFGVPLLTPKGFSTRAAIIILLFLVCQIAGLREYTSLLCGTLTTGGAGREFVAFMGISYVMIYFAVVIGVPILVLGAGIFSIAQRFWGQDTERNENK